MTEELPLSRNSRLICLERTRSSSDHGASRSQSLVDIKCGIVRLKTRQRGDARYVSALQGKTCTARNEGDSAQVVFPHRGGDTVVRIVGALSLSIDPRHPEVVATAAAVIHVPRKFPPVMRQNFCQVVLEESAQA